MLVEALASSPITKKGFIFPEQMPNLLHDMVGHAHSGLCHRFERAVTA
jgi:hypothetical protein